MILLLGGTSESLEVADLLTARHLSFVDSVISDYGAELARQHAANVAETTFTVDNFAAFCRDQQVKLIIDATHPFARVISRLAIDQAQKLNIPYLRFERQNNYDSAAKMKMVDSLAEACEYLTQFDSGIYLSTGSKTAPEYAQKLGVGRLHVRVLPTTRVMENLTAAGYIASQIDAIQGPFSVTLNKELFKHAKAKVVVTKESGRQGGVQEKITACEQLGLPIVIIRRPQLDYPQQVGSLDELTTYLEEHNEW
jgi:precorrin-6A/cobalt-precorrin-6A reductase